MLEDVFKNIDDICMFNSKKVLEAFWKCHVSEAHFTSTSGYGYGDIGRDTVEEVYKTIFKAEDALVRNQFISGTHALSTAFFGLLRPGDLLLSICGKPYDTLDSVIGINNNLSSLKSFGINYDQIELVDNDFNYDVISKYLRENKVKVIEIQRSIGYSDRKCISIEQLKKVIKLIKSIDKDIIVMIDNCYCEFVGKKEPIEVGADICVGSLIKNLGGGIASNGAYIVGRSDLIHLCSERLNVAGEAKEVGPSLGANKMFLQGLYFAPSVVASALKTNVYASCVPIPTKMPGYDDEIIMASGSFTQGSSIEISCDGPLRSPYIAYLQGGLTFEYGKIAVLKAIENIK